MPDINLEQLANYFSLYRAELHRFLLRRVDCEQIANDLLQDTYLRFVDYKDQQTIENPRAFLYRIAGNLAIDHLRTHQRQKLLIADFDNHDHHSAQTLINNPEHIIDQQQQLQRLQLAINQLDPVCRDVFIRSRFQGQTHQQIANDLGKSKSWVEKQIVQALRHCQQALEINQP
jgi:RNA polymerase sigma factor (sigma-70 family)